ncbi:MAG: hypothetical protein SOW08_01750 [Lachnospiraceae bacterium]|nr:hypothetical protein [Lachnospiraceae bacterium]
MRRKVICAFVLAMLLSAAACGSRGKGSSDPGSDKDSVSGTARTGRIEDESYRLINSTPRVPGPQWLEMTPPALVISISSNKSSPFR